MVKVLRGSPGCQQPAEFRSQKKKKSWSPMAVSGAYCTISSCPRRLLPIPRCGPSSSSKPTLKLQSLASSTLLAFGAGAALAMSAFLSPGEALAALEEPTNALSLPTWAIHVSSVVEWVTAMVLVWEYGEKSGFEAWKGLSWGMVPLLGGALCACTWHFFYNSESLEVLVAMQAGLTVIGNMTMCFAAFRIFKASQEGSTKS